MIKPNRKTVRAAIRASVPDGKLAKSKIVLTDAPLGSTPIGGFTEYSRDKGGAVVKLGAPAGDGAFAITVRGHETRHASKHRPTRKTPLTENAATAGQIVDDVNIETLALPNAVGIDAYRRAHLATAMNDVRTIARNARSMKAHPKENDTIVKRNGQLLRSVRALSMLSHYGQTGEETVSRDRGYVAVQKAIGHKTFKAIGKVIQLAKMRRKRASAISVLLSLMEVEESPEQEEEKEGPIVEGEYLSPVTGGDALDGHMRILDLRPKSVFCAKEKTITRRHAPSGVILNAARYVNAVVSGESHGLFSRRVRQKPGGTVVIDASGSMGATRENLAALCELIPTATVAYYSGGSRGSGELVVYAKEGKRFAGELPDDTLHGGNAVDLPAVKWLMEHGKPWTLISDLEFCGGLMGSEVVAHAMVERATKRGDLTVHHSLDAAHEAFGGTTQLADAEVRRKREARREAFRKERDKIDEAATPRI